jgi:hypothetical protein
VNASFDNFAIHVPLLNAIMLSVSKIIFQAPKKTATKKATKPKKAAAPKKPKTATKKKATPKPKKAATPKE